MSINEISDCLVENQEFIGSNFSASQIIINNSMFIQNMILGSLKIQPGPTSTKFPEVMFSPANVKLFRSYQPDYGIPFLEHVKSRLCPDDFFSFEFAEIKLPREMRHRIFRLLDWKHIVELLLKYKALDPKSNIKQVIEKKNIVKLLYNKFIWNATCKFKLMAILAEVDQLRELPNFLGTVSIYGYDGLCYAIKMMVITQKLVKAALEHSTGFDSLRPLNFLNIAGITVSDEQRQRIFKLISLKTIAQLLISDKDSMKSKDNIRQIINKDEMVKRLHDWITTRYSLSYKMVDILAENEQLKGLPPYLNGKTLNSYDELCELIKKFIASLKSNANDQKDELPRLIEDK